MCAQDAAEQAGRCTEDRPGQKTAMSGDVKRCQASESDSPESISLPFDRSGSLVDGGRLENGEFQSNRRAKNRTPHQIRSEESSGTPVMEQQSAECGAALRGERTKRHTHHPCCQTLFFQPAEHAQSQCGGI